MRRFAFVMLFLFIFTIPFEDQLRLGGLGSVSRLAGLATFAVALPALLAGDRLRVRAPSPFLLATVAWIGWTGVSYAWSIQPLTTLRSAITGVQLLAMVWLVWEFARSEARRLALMQAYVLGGYVSFGLGMTAFLSSGGFRDVGNIDANYFATLLALGIPFAWRLSAEVPSRWLRLLDGAYIPMALVASVLAASRGGLLTSLVALTVLVATIQVHRPFLRISQLAVLAALGAAAYAGLMVAVPALGDNTARLAEIPQEIQSGTLTNRRLIWSAGYRVFGEHPALGVGAGNFGTAIADVYGVRAAAHNTFLSVLVDGGVPGLALFALVLATALGPTLAASPVGRATGVALFAALMVAFMPLSLESRKTVWFALAVLAGERNVLVTFARTTARTMRPRKEPTV